MTKSIAKLPPEWDDPDLPDWTKEELDQAEFSIGNRVIRAATGTLNRPGRPPHGDAPKRQVTLRLDPDVIDAFRAGGAGWQSRMNSALRKAVGL
jgi:uncharacterized protein (DUF4415 family)